MGTDAMEEFETIVGLLEQRACQTWGAIEAFCINPERRLGDPQFSDLLDEFQAAYDALNGAVRAGKC
jgi:hypothetical protein